MISNHQDKRDKQRHAKKILIILDQKYKYDISFLKLGPIKSIKNFGGNTVNVDFTSKNYTNIIKRFKQTDNPKRIYLNKIAKNKSDLFFINSIKILIYIYYSKQLTFLEYNYRTSFITNLQTIHNGITVDNIEYLESTELIQKENKDGHIIIKINHKHQNLNLKCNF